MSLFKMRLVALKSIQPVRVGSLLKTTDENPGSNTSVCVDLHVYCEVLGVGYGGPPGIVGPGVDFHLETRSDFGNLPGRAGQMTQIPGTGPKCEKVRKIDFCSFRDSVTSVIVLVRRKRFP